jgi:hypothetical protein
VIPPIVPGAVSAEVEDYVRSIIPLTSYTGNPFTIKVKSNILNLPGDYDADSYGSPDQLGPLDTYLNKLQFGARGDPRDPRFRRI